MSINSDPQLEVETATEPVATSASQVQPPQAQPANSTHPHPQKKQKRKYKKRKFVCKWLRTEMRKIEKAREIYLSTSGTAKDVAAVNALRKELLGGRTNSIRVAKI